MGIIIDAFALFFYEIYAESCRRSFERALKRRFLSGVGVTCPYLTAKSNKTYRVRSKLQHMEREFRRKVYAK